MSPVYVCELKSGSTVFTMLKHELAHLMLQSALFMTQTHHLTKLRLKVLT